MNTVPAPGACRHCGRPLEEPDRRRGLLHCRAAACRSRTLVAQHAVHRQALAARAAAAVPVAAGSPPPLVVWLHSARRDCVPVTDADRARLRAELLQALQEPPFETYHGADTDAVVVAEGDRLCGQCGGDCCTHGGRHHGFIDSAVLQRWQDAHPGADAATAVEAYVARLPATHVEGSCLFHTHSGCTVPRAHRAHVCNRYACQPLQDVRQAVLAAPGRPVVALTLRRGMLERAARIDATGTQQLPALQADGPLA